MFLAGGPDGDFNVLTQSREKLHVPPTEKLPACLLGARVREPRVPEQRLAPEPAHRVEQAGEATSASPLARLDESLL
jgi:hypothetical protein